MRAVRAAVAVAAALAALSACTEPSTPDPGPTDTATPTSGQPEEDPSAATVRASLGALEPCQFLASAGGGATARLAVGPHTCSGDLSDGTRVSVEVGVPFDSAARDALPLTRVGGFEVHEDESLCRVVVPVAQSHGIAVSVGQECAGLPEAADLLTGALEQLAEEQSTFGWSACGLLDGLVVDPAALVDRSGDLSQGLDHCEELGSAPLAGTRLTLSITRVPLAEAAGLLGGETVRIAGREAVLVPSPSGTCTVHTRLGSAERSGGDPAWVEATLHAVTCDQARELAAGIVSAARQPAPAPTPLAEILDPGR